MIDVNWELAPEGATMIIQYNDTLTWAKDGFYWVVASDEWEADTCANENIVLATRSTEKPVTTSIPLTKAEIQSGMDRVQWAENLIKQLPDDHDGRNSWLLNYGSENKEKTVADAVEQEGEKWTHTYGSDKCYIKESEPDFQGYIIIYSNEGGYMLVKPRELKPIKPTITKAEAWDKLNNLPAHEWEINSHVMELHNKYDII